MYIGSGVWQTMGFNAIIYIAALIGISPEYYEAAIMDGASRFKRVLYIDIPMIMADRYPDADPSDRKYHECRIRKGLADAEWPEHDRQ